MVTAVVRKTRKKYSDISLF